tara:strand:- start:30 stop:290 length:261 start_codon:yes stop_codon:yes gene_type:complete
MMQPEDLERIAAGLLNEVPANFSTSDLRDVIVELLFGLGVSPSDLPMFCLLLIDKYVADNKIESPDKEKPRRIMGRVCEFQHIAWD